MNPEAAIVPAGGMPGPGALRPRSGLLAVDKVPGVTSHDVVEIVRRRLGARGAGHLGTLDPFASGLLLVAIGAATRCVTVWQSGEKTYEGTIRLGVVTDTQDLTGQILERCEVSVTEDAVRAAAEGLVGETEQVPPMVSALKVRGERLYRIARRGETVERTPRRVRVAAWEWLGFALPEARFRVRCSSGTYVRTLAHDLGRRLATGGALSQLRRIRSEPFSIERALPMSDLEALEPGEAWARGGIPLEEALAGFPHLRLDAAQAEAVGHGGRPLVSAEAAAPAPLGAGPRSIVLSGPGGETLGLGGLEAASPGEVRVCPNVVFPWAVREGPR